MAIGQKYLPYEGQDVDIASNLMPPTKARFIKNLVYSQGDTSTATKEQGGQYGSFKPLQSNAKYLAMFSLPDEPEDNIFWGDLVVKETQEVFVWIYNKKKNHTIYRINGWNQTYDIVYQSPVLNLQLNPENFIHKGGAYLEIVYITNPVTLEKVRRTFLMFTDGFNPQRFICVEDAIATHGFNPLFFPYFSGNYDPMILINMGVPTPMDCISIKEIPNETPELNNTLLFTPWQFRLRHLDVWGRPSEYGVISELYVPAANDCISSGSGLSRCLELMFDAPPPHINQVEVAYRKCNSQQWYTAQTLDLYDGPPLGKWWLRQRNPKVNYNSQTNKITYQFCNDKECNPIDPALTNRVSNPLARTSQSVAKVGKFVNISNNKDGFFPFPQSLKDKITITVEPPEEQAAITNSFRNIDVWMEIYNVFSKTNQPIYRQGITDPSNLRYGFGAHDGNLQYRSFLAYKQYFPNPEQKGFIGILAGPNISTISKQYVLKPDGSLSEITDFENIPGIDTGDKYFQKFEFRNVPKGIWIFRVISHQADPAADQNWASTSTYTAGVYGFNIGNVPNPVNHNLLVAAQKELIIDVCEENYDGLKDNKILVIWDLVSRNVDVIAGYVRNTNLEDQSQYPIEYARIDSWTTVRSTFTDHNGFYFAAGAATGGAGVTLSPYGYCNCSLVKFATKYSGTSDRLWEENFFLNLATDNGGCPNYNAQVCNYVQIKGRIIVCGTNIGVPNVAVLLSSGGSAITDSDGNYTIIAHDDTYNSSRNDKVYFVTTGCPLIGCDAECIQPIPITINKCISCSERIIEVPTVSALFRTQRGLLSGATYPINVVGHDWLGRETFAQSLGTLTIPSVQQTKLFAPSKVKISIDPSALFPVDIDKISFYIGSPATIDKFITWIVDKVELIDNTGNINKIAPTQIKIHYASLIEYNKQNNFNTTVNWQFIDADTNEPVVADTVEFLLNGDGQFFQKSISALVKYAKDGQYFLINYTSDLKDLEQNALIRIVRPKVCTSKEPSFEVCSTIQLVNRRAVVQPFYLNAFDTYYVNRRIPVPVDVGDATINELRLFGAPFESNSPSDFWGEGCHNIGRVNFENPQESEIYRPEQISISGGLSDTGLLNFLNFFFDDDSKKINLDDIGLNGIVSILYQTSIALILGQSNHCIIGYGDNIARVNDDGQVQVASITGYGKPQVKTEDNYGCLLKDKATISSLEGNVCWLDTIKAIVVHNNYRDAIPLSKNGADSYIRPKVKTVQQFNLINNNIRYFIGHINPINFEYFITDKIIGSTQYINDLRVYEFNSEETVSFDIITKSFKATYPFIPEGYSSLEGEINNTQLFTFKNGIPYRHYTVNPTSWGTFYGVRCNRVLKIVVAMDMLKKKKLLSIGCYCKQGTYFIPEVTTEMGQTSRSLLSQWLQAEFGFYSPFLCDLNTPFDPNRPNETGNNKLMDGNMLSGDYAEITLVGNPELDDKFTDLQGFTIQIFPSENSGTKP